MTRLHLTTTRQADAESQRKGRKFPTPQAMRRAFIKFVISSDPNKNLNIPIRQCCPPKPSTQAWRAPQRLASKYRRLSSLPYRGFAASESPQVPPALFGRTLNGQRKPR